MQTLNKERRKKTTLSLVPASSLLPILLQINDLSLPEPSWPVAAVVAPSVHPEAGDHTEKSGGGSGSSQDWLREEAADREQDRRSRGVLPLNWNWRELPEPNRTDNGLLEQELSESDSDDVSPCVTMAHSPEGLLQQSLPR